MTSCKARRCTKTYGGSRFGTAAAQSCTRTTTRSSGERSRSRTTSPARSPATLAVLERLNTMKGDFLPRISHQFRTALVGILGFSELIRDSEDLDLPKVRAFASDIYRDAERLDHAFDDMLELDRMEGGRAVLKIGQVDVNQLISGVVDEARDQNARHNIDVSLRSEEH